MSLKKKERRKNNCRSTYIHTRIDVFEDARSRQDRLLDPSNLVLFDSPPFAYSFPSMYVHVQQEQEHWSSYIVVLRVYMVFQHGANHCVRAPRSSLSLSSSELLSRKRGEKATTLRLQKTAYFPLSYTGKEREKTIDVLISSSSAAAAASPFCLNSSKVQRKTTSTESASMTKHGGL